MGLRGLKHAVGWLIRSLYRSSSRSTSEFKIVYQFNLGDFDTLDISNGLYTGVVTYGQRDARVILNVAF